ncbi:hypothetical protein, partial [Arsenicibacter rosenii]|uniref:hypothetical protein n=1 Tax=Arsenicibacter rosenii TaxID=1750698 RepID=UPI001C430A3F
KNVKGRGQTRKTRGKTGVFRADSALYHVVKVLKQCNFLKVSFYPVKNVDTLVEILTIHQ